MNVKMTDISEITKKARLSYENHSPENKKWEEYNKKLRTSPSKVADKFAKDHGWSVISAKWDFSQKGINYRTFVAQGKTAETFVPYEKICKEFNWKSFKIDDNFCSLFPTPLTEAEIKASLAGHKAKEVPEESKEDEKPAKKDYTAPTFDLTDM